MPPGVDHEVFFPRSPEEAKARLHLSGARILLFVGRLQPHKGPDVAIASLAEAVSRDPASTKDVVLAVVGGPSGRTSEERDEVSRLMDLAAASGVGDRVMFFPPQPQHIEEDDGYCQRQQREGYGYEEAHFSNYEV